MMIIVMYLFLITHHQVVIKMIIIVEVVAIIVAIIVTMVVVATVATIDREGSFSALMPGAQGMGQIVGPNIAASILGADYGYSSVFSMCVIFTGLSIITYLFMRSRLEKYSPQILEK